MIQTERFDSVFDSIGVKEKMVNPDAHNQRYFENVFDRDLSDKKSLEWYGIKGSSNGVKKAIQYGWTDGVNRMLRNMETITGDLKATSIRRVLHRGSSGDELDIHRVYSGSLGDAWTSRKRARRTAPQVIQIACNIGISYGQEPDELFWRGAAVLKLADLLTEAGYAVELVAFTSSDLANEAGDGLDLCTTVKQSDAPLDLNSMAATFCLAGFPRMAMLSKMVEVQAGKVADGYGRPADRVPEHCEDAILCPRKITSKVKAVEWLQDQIHKLENN